MKSDQLVYIQTRYVLKQCKHIKKKLQIMLKSKKPLPGPFNTKVCIFLSAERKYNDKPLIMYPFKDKNDERYKRECFRQIHLGP